MSVIVAVKGDGCVYLAADSQATGSRSDKYILDAKHGKLRQITPQLVVGCTRSMALLQCLGKAEKWAGRDAMSLMEIAAHVHSEMRRDLIGYGLMERNKETGAEELPGTLLVAWKEDFVEVCPDATLIKPAARWHAIGSGADVARGALQSTRYWAEAEPAAWATLAVLAACELDTYCSEPIITAVTRP